MSEDNNTPPGASQRGRSIACPNCGSSDVVKASVAHEMGTATGSYSSIGIGVGDDDVGAGLAQTGGRSTSEFAQRLAPPSSGMNEFGCAGAAALAVFVGIVFLFDPPSHSALWALLTLGPAAATYYYTYKHLVSAQQGERTAKLAEYDRLWVCLRCGQTADKDTLTKPM